MPIRELTAKFGADTTGFQKGTEAVRKQLTQLNSDFYANKKAMKDVDTEIKKLEKEQKALSTAMKNAPTAEQEKEYRKLSTQLNRLSLQKAELKTKEQELKQQTSLATSELKKQSEASQQNKLSMQQVGDTLKKVAMLTSTAMAGLFTYAAKMGLAADDINTLSTQTGIATDEIQKFQYASDLVDVDLNTLTKSYAKLIKNMSTATSESGDAYEAFQALHVEFQNGDGTLRDKMDVYDDVINALSQMENETQRDAYAFALFGKSAQSLNTLIEDGGSALAQYGDEAEKLGLVLSQDQLDKLNAFNDKVDLFKSKLGATAMLAAGDAVDAFDDLFDSTDEVCEIVKEVITTFAKATGFVIEHKEAVLALAVAMVTFKGSMSIIGLVMSLGAAIKSVTTATEGATAAQIAFNGAAAINPYVLLASVLAGLAVGVGIYAANMDTATKRVNKMNEAMQNLEKSHTENKNQIDAEISRINNLKDKYDELRTKTNQTADDKANLKTVAEELKTALGGDIEYVDILTGSYKDLTAEINNVANSMKTQAEISYQNEKYDTAFSQNKEIGEDTISEYKKTYGTIDELRSKYESAKTQAMLTALVPFLGMVQGSQYKGLDYALKEWQKYNENLKIMEDAQKAVNDVLKTGNDDLNKQTQTTVELSTALSKLQSSYNTVKSAQEEYNSSGNFSLSTLQSLAQQYPTLEERIQLYSAGMITAKDLLNDLQNAYKTDLDKYNEVLSAKMMNNEDFYKKAIQDSGNKINKLAEHYGVDLRNFKTLEEAKKAIQRATFEEQAKYIAYYYGIQDRTIEQQITHLRMLRSGDHSREISILEQRLAANKEIEDAFKSVPSDKDEKSIDDLFNPTTIKTNGGSSSNGNSSSTSSTAKTVSVYEKANAAFKKMVDDRLEQIQKLTDAEQAAADKRIDAIDKEIEARKRLTEDNDIDKRINAVKAELKYSKLDEFSRMELEKQLKTLQDEKSETQWQRKKADEKEAIQTALEKKKSEYALQTKSIQELESYASLVFSDLQNGYKSAQSIVNNNSSIQNLQIVNSALTEAQVEKKIKDKLGTVWT